MGVVHVIVATELTELEESMKKYVLRRTKSLIASQLPRKGTYMYMYIIHAHVYMYMYM